MLATINFIDYKFYFYISSSFISLYMFYISHTNLSVLYFYYFFISFPSISQNNFLLFLIIFSRQEQEITQRNLFEKAHFATFLRESFLPYPTNSDDLPDKTASEETANKFVARGLIMNCANAIRLQVNIINKSDSY